MSRPAFLLLASCLAASLAVLHAADTPNLIVPGTDPTGVWGRVQEKVWNVFRTSENFACTAFDTNCPCINENNRPSPEEPLTCVVTTNVLCGSMARKAWRTSFHDAGTYDKADNTGGLDGSIQFELERSENAGGRLFEIVDEYTAILDSEKTELGTLPNGRVHGMADIVALGGLLAIRACGHPGLPWAPGRTDAQEANKPGMLPGTGDTAPEMFTKFTRMGFTKKEVVTLMAAGHTIASLDGAAFDGTPAVFDNVWHKDMLTTGGPFVLATDVHLVTDNQSRMFMEEQADAATGKATFFNALKGAVQKMNYLGQGICIAPKAIRIFLA